jgi:Tfp pilus assembly protein PilF
MVSTEPMPNARPVDPRIFQSPQKLKVILCLLLALATISLYSSVTRAPFLNYDDAIHVTDNPQVRAGLTWRTVVWAFRTSEASDWHPMTWLSHALDCQLFGLGPEGPHTVNLLLHTANALLVFLVLAGVTGLVWRSFAVAAFFALHPINVESVAWISERKDVLSMFFFLLALAAYGWYARRPGVARYMAVTVAYCLALMSKAQVITFPFALLLLDYWPLQRLLPAEEAGRAAAPSLWKLVGEKVPWFALSLASAIITIRVEGDATQAALPFWIHLGNAAISYIKYLGKAFWPADLALVYPHPGFAISKAAAMVSAFAIVSLSILAVGLRERRYGFVGWFWFLGTLVPMIGLVQISVHGMADRYAYIPLLGIFVVVGWGSAELARRMKVPAVVVTVCTAAVFLALAIGLFRQVGFWRDNITLWAHTLKITQANYTAEDNLATAFLAQGRIGEAMPHFQRALLFRPDDVMATLNIATFQQMTGNYQAALDGYARVLQTTKVPSLLINARVNSGYAHYSLKQYDRAQQDFGAVLKEQPENWSAYRGLGLLAQRAGDIGLAVRDYQRSVELQPSAVGFLLLAQALAQAGQGDAGRAAESQAAGMTRDLSDEMATVKQLLAN